MEKFLEKLSDSDVHLPGNLNGKKYCAACGKEVDPHACAIYRGDYFHHTKECHAAMRVLVRGDTDLYRRKIREELAAKKQCLYDIPYHGPCHEPADESGFCPEHKGLKCYKCGRQATYGSSDTTTGFVMGNPLCDEHS